MKRQSKLRRHNSGFTLIELTLVIILMAGITMAIAYSAQKAIDKMNYERSQVMVQNIKYALDLFAQKVNHYPCPARPGLAKTDANYGREDCAWIMANQAYDSNRGIGTYPKFPVTINSPSDNQVLIGNLPSYVRDSSGAWVTLGQNTPAIDRVSSNLLLDSTGNPLIYAVAKKLTDSGTSGAIKNVSLSDYGNINLVDENGAPLSGVNNDARYVVIAQTYKNGGCIATHRDFENCGSNDDKFVVAPRALNTDDGAYFDDVVLFNNTTADQKWLSDKPTEISGYMTNSPETRGLIYANQNGNNIGIGTVNPTEKLTIAGTLRAEKNIRAPLICDTPEVTTSVGAANPVTFTGTFTDPSQLIVKIKPAAGSEVTKVLGTDYSVNVGTKQVTFTLAPLATDTVTITKSTCLNPLSLFSRPEAEGVYSTQSRDDSPSLSCPNGGEISTSGILAASGVPEGDPRWDVTTSCVSVNLFPEGLCAQPVSGTRIYPGDKGHAPRIELWDPNKVRDQSTGIVITNYPSTGVSANSGNYWQLKVNNRFLTQSRGPYSLDRPGQTIILYRDTGDVHNAGRDLAAQNEGIKFRIIGTKAKFRRLNRALIGDCSYNTGMNAARMASARACNGWDMSCDSGGGPPCPFNEEMSVILLEPLPGQPTPLAQYESPLGCIGNVCRSGMVNFKMVLIGQYLAGTKIDQNGTLRPICKDLAAAPVRTRNADGTNTCPVGQQLRGIQTDGKAVCSED